MLIGDFPTKGEYQQGLSFSASSGNLMKGLLRGAGINADRVYKTHYYKVPIPGWFSPNKQIKEASLAAIKDKYNWSALITREIEEIKPTIILLSGELALKEMTGETGIHKWRGSYLNLIPLFDPGQKINVVPIHSPTEIWQLKEKPLVYTQWDIIKAV